MKSLPLALGVALPLSATVVMGCSGSDASVSDDVASGGSVSDAAASGGSASPPRAPEAAGAEATGAGAKATAPSASSSGGTGNTAPVSAGTSATGATKEYAERCGGGQLLTGVVRDFDPASHPDFEPTNKALRTPEARLYHTKQFTRELGIVWPMLGADFKPVYAGSESTGTQTTFGTTWFQSWFRDTPGLNASTEVQLELVDYDGDGVFTFDNGGQPFLPIDRQLLGDSYYGKAADRGVASHNYSFTYELHARFSYDDDGMLISVAGNDDLWVFVGGRLLIDLGGLGTKSGRIRLRDLGLPMNREYQLDIFGAERVATDSQFALETNVRFTNCAVPVPR